MFVQYFCLGECHVLLDRGSSEWQQVGDPCKHMGSGFTDSSVLTLVGSLFPGQEPASEDGQLTQSQKALFREHLQKLKHPSGTASGVLPIMGLKCRGMLFGAGFLCVFLQLVKTAASKDIN